MFALSWISSLSASIHVRGMCMTPSVSGNGLMLIKIEFGVLASRDIHRTTIATRRNLVLRHAGNIFHLTQVGWFVFLP
jgi:hypothetical protein